MEKFALKTMLKLAALIYGQDEFNDFYRALISQQRIKLRGIYGSFLAFVVKYVQDTFETPLLVITPDSDAAEKLVDDLQTLTNPSLTTYLPSDEVVPFDRGLFTPALYSMRLNALSNIVENKARILVTTPQALLRRVPQPDALKQHILHLNVGEDLERELLIDWLINSGYERVGTIEELGQFSARGGIVDVFSFESDVPVRIEYFGDTIESIREFDVLSQLSTREIKSVRLVGQSPQTDATACLLDYFPDNSLIFWEDSEQVRKLLKEWWEQATERFEERRQELDITDIEQHYIPLASLLSRLERYRQIEHSHFGKMELADVHFNANPPASFRGNMKLFLSHIEKFLQPHGNESRGQLFVLHEGPAARERLEDILEAELGYLPPIQFIEGELHQGFYLPSYHIEVLTEHEIFHRLKTRRRKRRIRVSGSLIRSLNSLNYGDFVVHVDYGIGKYMGLERIQIAGRERDVIKILYEDNDILYVNLDNLNRIQKYVSEEGFQPKLTRLGSPEWERVKKRTRKAVENIARELVQLYAQRMAQKGHAFSPDTLWQKELEASFPYEDTPDQIRATQEVKRDMESPKPMDRLICGDVGYGKTEIAIRAAFKAVMDGKQVAVLVPTTILAQQHFHTFRERMANFPVNIEVLSRFRTPREQKDILQRLASGEIDIIIGTHRLLSNDVQFKDLGLLIVDEEQRFGVSHKEKLKKIKVTVDTLTLTATPIPRTLHMALMGARDLSNVDTPPSNRHPVITEITTWDRHLIYRAITYEIERGGQVFFVHNRVQTIDGVAAMLKNIVPRARIAVAHGQMRERQLEKIMNDFYHRKYDVLVATMIIENGLDIPNCNTIIINRADQFGLAQLYQLRGRVGRSDRQAYAYLIIPPQERLNETAIKRLYAIEEFGDLGSGLKIAMRDLEIRGAGNLLGHQQSGFINAVGYDLYQKILQEAVEDLQQETLPDAYLETRMPKVDAKVDIDTEMYLPDDYVNSPNEKVMIYHRLLNLDNLHLIDNLVRELRDRFGPLPEPTQKLIEMVKIKKLASQLYIKQVKIHQQKMILIFDERATEKELFIEQVLPKFVNQNMANIFFSQGKELKVTVHLKGRSDLDRISFAKNFLLNL
ncbi:MAG: transcription-repair coupling factor [Calditrichaeota bacterium]|nr:transcription-repair coupling factor [Calditrichota bacterium]